MDEYERVMLEESGILSVLRRIDGEVVYVDKYELRLEDWINKSLADIVDMHLSKKISDEKFNRLIKAHEHAELIKRSTEHGKQ